MNEKGQLRKAIYKALVKKLQEKKNKNVAQEIIEDILDPNDVAQVDPRKIPKDKINVLNKGCGAKKLKETIEQRKKRKKQQSLKSNEGLKNE